MDMGFDNNNHTDGMNASAGAPFDGDFTEEVTVEEEPCESVVETSFADDDEVVIKPPAAVHRTNEYIYNDSDSDKGGPAKSKGGIIAFGIIACLLATFVVSVISISAYVAIADRRANKASPDVSQDKNNSYAFPNTKVTSADSKDKLAAVSDKPEPPPSNTADGESDKNYPSLEQLAAPEDALGLPDIYDKVSPSVVGVSCTLARGSTTGTGIILSENGYIITNAHVVEDAASIMIVDSLLNEYEAKVVGADAQTDLAVLKVEASGLTPCEFGKSSELRIGELAVVIGNPLGMDLYGTMTFGIISGLNRTITIGENKMTLIQTQASINKGNSGGPLINAYGQVIGITSAKVNTAYGEGLGFAIPIDGALPIIDDLMEYGYVTGRPMIGISGEDITYIMSLYYRLPQGVCVRFVTPESGAETAGIKVGDIIIGVNNTAIATMDELTEAKNQFSAGDTVILNIYRDGVSIDISVVLSEVTSGSSN